MSRRCLLAAGAGAMVSACAARTATTGAPAAPVPVPVPVPAASEAGANQEIIRKWYAAWRQTDWAPLEALMADDFTFSSAAGDDHISKSTYKAQCWENQKGRIARFELELISVTGDEALVKGSCQTKMGKTFRNVEYFRFKDGKIEAIECYFGDATTGYPSKTDKNG
jgi:ketosteroid isomerase-like protein